MVFILKSIPMLDALTTNGAQMRWHKIILTKPEQNVCFSDSAISNDQQLCQMIVVLAFGHAFCEYFYRIYIYIPSFKPINCPIIMKMPPIKIVIIISQKQQMIKKFARDILYLSPDGIRYWRNLKIFSSVVGLGVCGYLLYRKHVRLPINAGRESLSGIKKNGQKVTLDILSVKWKKEINKNDIVAFHCPWDQYQVSFKKVTALPGEKAPGKDYILKDGEIWVESDLIEYDSITSKDFGPLKIDLVIGKVMKT